MRNFFTKKKGMSLVELLVGAGIFVMLTAISASAGIMIYKGKAKIQYTNELYSETRFLMERMIRDVRVNTIDYYEYFSQNIGSYSNTGGLSSVAGQYGENPGLYELFFYYIPNSGDVENDVSSANFSWKSEDRDQDISIGVFNTNADNDSDNDFSEYTLIQSEFSYSPSPINPDMGLFLLSGDGKTKTLYRYKTENFGTDDVRGVIEIAKMKLINTSSDATIVKNEWVDFYSGGVGDSNASSQPQWVSITPPNISVTGFSFVLSPRDDPQKAFAKPVNATTGETVQIQPHVILKISAKLINKKARSVLGANSEFSLQSSASSRIFHNVTFPRD